MVSAQRKIHLYRLLEQVAYVLIVASAAVILFRFQTTTSLDDQLLVTAATTLIIAIILVTIAGIKLEAKLRLVEEQADFTENEQFLYLYEKSPVPYVTLNKEGVVIKFNQAAVKLLNSTQSDLSDDDFLARIVATADSEPSILTSKIQAGITLTDREVSLQANDQSIWVLLSSFTNNHNHETLISLVDITEAKKVDTAKSEFVALATHQLRTPVVAIRWNTELLRNYLGEGIEEKPGQYLNKIERNAGRMMTMINDFLNASKLEMGTFATEKATLNISELFDSVIDEFAEKIAQKQIQVERTEQPANAQFKSDYRLLHSIVNNLISNAVKYSQTGGTIRANTTLSDQNLTIVIADDGIGIPAKEQENLFGKFYRASNAEQHETQGTGLGLYIAKQAVDMLGGTIEVAADTDQGAVFTVLLPR